MVGRQVGTMGKIKEEHLIMGEKEIKHNYNLYTYESKKIAECIDERIFVYYEELVNNFKEEECYNILTFIADKELKARINVECLLEKNLENGILLHKIFQKYLSDEKVTIFIGMQVVEDLRLDELVDYYNCEEIFNIGRVGY